MNYFTQISLIKNSLRSLTDSLRGTGRTVSILNSMGDNEVIFVVSSQDQADARRFFQMHRIKADAFAVGTDFEKIEYNLRSKTYKKIHFDHRLIESMVSRSIENLNGHINNIVELNDAKFRDHRDKPPYFPEFQVKS